MAQGTTTLPPTFSISLKRVGAHDYRLTASQIISLPREEAFTFFQNPGNLFDITPDWLDFRMTHADKQSEVCEEAEFDYTIRWLAIPLKWRSRIEDYNPPEHFADVQISGPYRYWRHEHLLREVTEGTLMEDEVTYCLPGGPLGHLVHKWTIRSQLREIFCYRAARIAEWAGKKTCH